MVTMRRRTVLSGLTPAGHSGGGIPTVGLVEAHRDERLKAGIVPAGTDVRGTPFSGPAAARARIPAAAQTGEVATLATDLREASSDLHG